jgi:hypothetical protein
MNAQVAGFHEGSGGLANCGMPAAILPVRCGEY